MSIKVENLKYIYNVGMPGETTALDDVSFEINSGEIIGIIGHTGSGKSTLLQHLNGLLKPISGSVFIDDVCITDASVKMVDIRKKVGLVFQYPEYQLFEETVAKDVAFGPKNLGIKGEELDKRVREAITLVGLDYDKVAESSPFELSGGMKRRVAIAGVIAMNPGILILDEPTAGLDPKAHREILTLIKKIHTKTEKTIIFVSHNMADIAEISDNILVIDKGRIALQGTPREVFSHHDELKEMGLGIPPIMEIMKKIAEEYPSLEVNTLTVEEATKEILEHINNK